MDACERMNAVGHIDVKMEFYVNMRPKSRKKINATESKKVSRPSSDQKKKMSKASHNAVMVLRTKVNFSVFLLELISISLLSSTPSALHPHPSLHFFTCHFALSFEWVFIFFVRMVHCAIAINRLNQH